MNQREQAVLRDLVARALLNPDTRGRQRLDDLPPNSPGKPLSTKQAAVARLWANGYTLKEIADMRGTASTSAVHHSLTVARKKLGVTSGRGYSQDRRDMKAALEAHGLTTIGKDNAE